MIHNMGRRRCRGVLSATAFCRSNKKVGSASEGKERRLVNGTSDGLQVNGGVNGKKAKGRRKKEDEIKQYECEG